MTLQPFNIRGWKWLSAYGVSTLDGIIHQKKCILPHPSGGKAQSDTAVRNIMALFCIEMPIGACCVYKARFFFRNFIVNLIE